MAIDSPLERRSAGNWLTDIVYPAGDGAISQQDRQHIAWIYRSIPVIPPPEPGGIQIFAARQSQATVVPHSLGVS